MDDIITILLRLIEENWIYTRLSEEKRSVLAITVLIIASAIQITLAFTGFRRTTLPLTIFLFLLGIYGVIFCLKLYERQIFHTFRARKLLSRLEEIHPEVEIEKLFETVEAEHSAKHPFAHVRLNHIWLWMHVCIGLLGLIETVLCILFFR